jgi:type IV pilus assembly protein PilF
MNKALAGVVAVVSLSLAACVSDAPAKVSPIDGEVALSKAGKERLNAAWGYMQAGNYQRAKHHLELALEHDPDSAQVYAAFGYFYSQVGETAHAREAFEKSLKLDRKDGENANKYGVFLCREGEFAKADAMFRQALAIRNYNNMAATLENAGLCALEAKDRDKAEEYFLRAVRHNPRQAEALLELGVMEFEQQNLSRARSYLDRYVETGGVSARSLWLGIQLARLQGDRDTLASWGLKLERLFPDSEEAVLYAKNKKQWQ